MAYCVCSMRVDRQYGNKLVLVLYISGQLCERNSCVPNCYVNFSCLCRPWLGTVEMIYLAHRLYGSGWRWVVVVTGMVVVVGFHMLTFSGLFLCVLADKRHDDVMT